MDNRILSRLRNFAKRIHFIETGYIVADRAGFVTINAENRRESECRLCYDLMQNQNPVIVAIRRLEFLVRDVIRPSICSIVPDFCKNAHESVISPAFLAHRDPAAQMVGYSRISCRDAPRDDGAKNNEMKSDG